MNSRKVLTLCLMVTLAGCGSQNPAPTNAPAAQSTASTASAPPATSIFHHDGCTIDIVKVCKSFIDQPQFTYNGDQYTWQRFQESAPAIPTLRSGRDIPTTA